MMLSPQDGHDFIELHGLLMLFAAQEAGALPKRMTVAELLHLGTKKMLPHRERVYQDITIVDHYLASLKGKVTEQTRKDVTGFKQFIRGQFYILKHYKKYTVLMDNDRLYGIQGLSQPIEDIVPKWSLPAMVEAVLVPFRGQLVYDGILMGSNVSFGRNITGSLNEQFNRIKAVHGIIDNLDAIEQAADATPEPDAEAERELRYIMNSMTRWDEQVYRLDELRRQFPELDSVYFECASKLYAKRRKKQLKAIGVTGRYYAVYFDTILASAATRKTLLTELAGITFAGRVSDCAVFKV